MTRAVKIAVSLSEELFEAVEKERQAAGETRSAFLARAAEAFLRRRREQEAVEAYLRGYREQPETEDEIAAMQAASASVLAQEPWQ